jgi:hypothetical protein
MLEGIDEIRREDMMAAFQSGLEQVIEVHSGEAEPKRQLPRTAGKARRRLQCITSGATMIIMRACRASGISWV